MNALAVLMIYCSCCGPAQAPQSPAPADEVLRWNEAALQAIKSERTPPPMAARNLAMVHVAIYEAVNALSRAHTHYLIDVVPPPGASAETAAAVAAHRVLLHLYPERADVLDDLLCRFCETVPEGDAKAQGVALGEFVAGKVLAWRRDDGAERSTWYLPRSGPGWWRPTPPDKQPALLPGWSRVTRFALRDLDEFRPAPPPPLTSAEYTAAFREVKALGGVSSSARTPEQTEIARFWADGDGTVTPPGHWNRIAQAAARSKGTTLAENARLFALLNVALADVAIGCWDCKYRYEVWRPVYAIREAGQDGNPDTEADVVWEPLLPTPPFPAYTSGHSSFSGAAAAVLAAVCGSDAARFSSESDGLPGVTRTYTSFSAAAAEAGKSRIYGGIHYEFDNAAGLAGGKAVGQYVVRHYMVPRLRGYP